VDFVERGMTSGRQVLGLAQSYLEPLQRAGVDTVVLGCTHYPLLSGVLQLALGPEVTLVSSAEETAKDVLRVLSEDDLLRERTGEAPAHEFLATGDPEPFRRLGRRFLGPEIGAVAGLGVGSGDGSRVGSGDGSRVGSGVGSGSDTPLAGRRVSSAG
jgi:glutamate racemase